MKPRKLISDYIIDSGYTGIGIELCLHYTTPEHPDFKPVCKLGHRAGLWCHKDNAPHYCGKYSQEKPL